MIGFKFPRTQSALALGALFLSLTLSGSAFAQTGTSSVRGTVTDPQGSAVAGASISLVSVETNTVRTQTTNESGTFFFDLIPPGTYRVDAEASGFKKTSLTDVKALVAKPTEIKLQLEVGNVAETVTVSSGANEVLLNTQDASLGNNFESRQITQLPLESRNVVQLLSLQPGVTPDGYVSGSRADQSNLTLDGIDVNEQQTGLDPNTFEAFSSVLRVTPDSIQEFRVTTTNANASQGRSSGAQVSLVTKSGTNEFKGGLYEFHRNTVTTANDFFSNSAGNSKPKLLRNVFGGYLGGPIKKDRLFFFYSYEGRRDASGQSIVETVPLPSLGAGNIRFLNSTGAVTELNADQLNAIYPKVGLNPVALSILADAAKRYPANDFTVGDGLNTAGFRFNSPISVRFNTHTAKFDWNVTKDARHLIFLRGTYQNDLIGTAKAFPDQITPTRWNHPYGFALGHTWTISSRKVNNLRYGLTRLAFTNQGNSTENELFYRGVYKDSAFSADQIDSFQRTFSRTTPVHNITDDFSWLAGNHNFQFGGDVRLIKNNRVDFNNSYDVAYTNYFFYKSSGNVLISPITAALPDGVSIDSSFITPVKAAAAALIGRLPYYRANFNFDQQGNALAPGTPIERTFATQEGEGYFQDTWKARQNLTLTYGLRYSLSRPVYETHGYQAKPDISLSEFLRLRAEGAAAGVPYNKPISVNLAGPVNNKPGYYKLDKNNFQPRVAIAWEPHFKDGLFHKVFGGAGDSVLRSGFAITNDFFGQQLAVNFESNNRLGFSSAQQISANTYNVTSVIAPLITGPNMSYRTLPRITDPGKLSFPQTQPLDGRRRIEGSLDDTLTSPTEYTWNLTYERKLPAGLVMTASYIGRSARHLLVTRDVATPNNLVDKKTGMDWYTAAGMLETLRVNKTPIDKVGTIPYFENIYNGVNIGDLEFGDPTLSNTQAIYGLVASDALGGYAIGNDWTTVQDILDTDTGLPLFYQPQYGALSAFSTVGTSIYHGGTISLRERFKQSLTVDFNYTLSKSMDSASGLQTSGVYGGALILNPFRPRDNISVSDFDIRHIININGIWQLPIGRGHAFLGDAPSVVNAILGGWQLSSIFRYNSGRPAGSPFDAGTWATNWEIESSNVRIRPIKESPTRGINGLAPNLFSDPTYAYQSFRSARPGETGDRNVFRYPGYIDLDAGLSKTFVMPWSEKQTLQFRWETFNVTNTQRFTGIANFGVGLDPQSGKPSPDFGRFTGIQGSPRVMQFGLRFEF